MADNNLSGLGSRASALIFDLVLIFVLMIIVGMLTWMPILIGFQGVNIPMYLPAFIGFIYFVVGEGRYGKTLGKKLAGIKVVKKDGSECGILRSLVRNVLRSVDILPFFYIIGIVLIAATSENQRIGDMAAGTVVIEEN